MQQYYGLFIIFAKLLYNIIVPMRSSVRSDGSGGRTELLHLAVRSIFTAADDATPRTERYACKMSLASGPSRD